jgi:transcriptional regulator with XRE-family HTH domain
MKVHIHVQLEQRRRKLGLSYTALAHRAGISLRMVRRILSGKESDPGLSTIASLACALGTTLRLSDEEEADVMRYRQAMRKAEWVVALVQGTSSLDGQGLPASAIADLRERTVCDLLAGSSRKLWED